MKPIKLSPSSLSLFKYCPLCFWMDKVKGLGHPSGAFPSLPNGMDKILKHHFDSYRQRGAMPPELSELNGVKLFSDIELLTVWRNNFKGISYHDPELDATLRGAVDDMLVDNGKLIVLDFKTRGFPVKEDTHESYQDQLNIYNYLLEKSGHEHENYAYLLFYYPEKVNTDGSVLFNTHLKKVHTKPANAEKLFRAAVKVLQKDESPAAADDCDHCGFVRGRGS